MTDYRLRTPQEWAEDQGVEIYLDGWRLAGVPLDLPITVQEFWRYCAQTSLRHLFYDHVNPPGRVLTGNPPRDWTNVDADFRGTDWPGRRQRESERHDEPDADAVGEPPAAPVDVFRHAAHGRAVPAPTSPAESDRTVAAAGA
jgi:hypothetical protein